MTQTKTATKPSDADLVAYLDGELSPADSVRLGQMIASDADSKRRLDQLLAGGRPFGAAFAPLLDAAPMAKLDAMLDDALHGTRPVARPRRFARLPSLAAAAIAIFAVGAGLDHVIGTRLGQADFATETDREGAEWRGAVADYLALYTRDTLARIPTQTAERERERDASQAGDRLGIPLLSAKAALGDLPLKRADLYDYDGKPLAFLAYLDPRQGPVALCIIQGGEPADPRVERRQDMNVVYWSDHGHSFMLIGHTPADELQRFATSVKARFAAGDTGRAG